MKVNSLQIVSEFTIDDNILLSCGPKLQEIESLLEGKIVKITIPESVPPEVSRVLVQGKDTIVGLSYNRLDITIQPPSHVVDHFDKCLDFAYSRIEQIYSILKNEINSYIWSGVVATISYPVEPTVESTKAIKPVFDKILTLDRKNREMTALNLQFGFRDSGYNLIYIIIGYENRKINFPDPNKQPKATPAGVAINPKDHALIESGIRIVFDVNNKNSENKKALDEIGKIMDFQKERFVTLTEDINLKGII